MIDNNLKVGSVGEGCWCGFKMQRNYCIILLYSEHFTCNCSDQSNPVYFEQMYDEIYYGLAKDGFLLPYS